MSETLHQKAVRLAARPYTVHILRDDSISEQPLYLALNPELEGCMAQGDTIEESESNLHQFRVDYIEHLLKRDLSVPYPAPMATMTGSQVVNAFPAITIQITFNAGTSTMQQTQDQMVPSEDDKFILEVSRKELA